MKISYNPMQFIRAYRRTTQFIDRSGLSEGNSSFESIPGSPGVVVGEVLTCEQHPNDR